ncbi:heme-dependent oxidative N-demethylase family protein [Antarctobacter jejuensis]|uniref:heme-dependent oxidative N-demethylase family protein n=1 Tax=Antarctobacter jejuensis TaxID=1439938 RepID=UPI003FD085AB
MILQSRIPYDVDETRPLPGIRPMSRDDWLWVDDAYTGQMAERRNLLSTRRAEVLALDLAALPAAQELLEVALELLPDGLLPEGEGVRCADGAWIATDRSDPLGTLGRMFQQDFCLMEKRGDQHVLTGAVLCFPASWRLDEKFLRPLTGIHDPVEDYDADIARRVQRLFDGVQPERPLWRFNALPYADPALHQPRSEQARRAPVGGEDAPFLRSERQCLVRLPRTRAVVFSIHTFVVARRDQGMKRSIT